MKGAVSSDAASSFLAGLFATAAAFCADPAVLMVSCVALAFLCAGSAGQGTGFNHGTQHLLIGAGTARGEIAGRNADVGAIKIEPDALSELLDHPFGQMGIRT
jgi:hypothetical protein